MDLSHLKVLVSGAGGVGVGSGVCEALDQFGAFLIINDIDSERAHQTAAKYRNALAVQADISNSAEVEGMFSKVGKEVGTINGLVNNAGVGLSKEVHKIEEGEFDRLFDINLKGTWLLTKYFVDGLLKAKEIGHIVNVSSVHAFASQPNYSTYASSKSAVEGFTRAIAYELGKYGIRANAIAPGMVHSDQNYDLIKTWTSDPKGWVKEFVDNQQVLHHLIKPVDCGNAVAFLLSDLSKSITGQTIYVDAGKTIMLFNRDYIDRN